MDDIDLKIIQLLEEDGRLSHEEISKHVLLKLRAPSPEELTHFIDELVKIPEIQETSTTFVLSTIYENGINELNTSKGDTV
ncbi:AsnC family transcriptional regulator [Paenibacillus sp. sgz500958]|uniref:AsnC family transcriptional regulator n=1 Tax=Paenibacillus sp. sgz500958 TaxID=3242475 RepID=UPI0036D31494